MVKAVRTYDNPGGVLQTPSEAQSPVYDYTFYWQQIRLYAACRGQQSSGNGSTLILTIRMFYGVKTAGQQNEN